MNLSSADQQARSRFQSGLLAWLRTAGDPSGLREMVAVVRGQAIEDRANALLWRSAEAFLQALLDGSLVPDDEARRLCRRLERLLSRPDGDRPGELAEALFAWVSNRAGGGGGVDAAPPMAAGALKGALGATAEVLPLLGLDSAPPRRCDDAGRARWQAAARALDTAWHALLTGRAAEARGAATHLVGVALELGDASALRLAEALADAVGLAEDAAQRDGAPFRAAVAAAIELAAAADGPDQKSFDDKVSQAVRRLADHRAPVRGAPAGAGAPRWFAEDAREWLQEIAAAIDAVPPKRIALLAGLDWLARQDDCSAIAVRGLATLAHQVIRQVRSEDLDAVDTHALLVATIAALDVGIAAIAAGQPPLPDEDVFARLRALDAELSARRQLPRPKPSQ